MKTTNKYLKLGIVVRGPRFWTEDKVRILKDNYGKMDIHSLKELLGAKSIGVIRTKAHGLRITRETKYKKWSEKELEFIRNNHKSMTLKEMANTLGRTENGVKQKKESLGLPDKKKIWDKNSIISKLRDLSKDKEGILLTTDIGKDLQSACDRYFGNFNNAKREARINLFKKPTKDYSFLSPEKAELIGIICGDGWINFFPPKKYGIGLSTGEYDFALHFCDLIKKIYGLETKINKRGERTTPYQGKIIKSKPCWVCCFNCKEAVEDILSYDDNNSKFKSKFFLVPKKILDSNNKEIIGSFIRGIFDSDGCACSKNNHLFLQIRNNEAVFQISKLLTDLGIFNSLYGKENFKSIYIRGTYSHKKYMEVISFSNERKLKELSLICSNNIKVGRNHSKKVIEVKKIINNVEMNPNLSVSQLPIANEVFA